MTDKKKSNVTKKSTKKKKSNVTPKRVTKKEHAKRIGRSPRSVRHEDYWTEYRDTIGEKVEALNEKDEYSTEFLSVFPEEFTSADKKQGLSLSELKLLSELPKDELIPIYEKLTEVKQNGGNLKAALRELLPNHKTKVTVSLPAYVDQWYTEQAKEKEMSKGAYLSWIMEKIYKINKDKKF